MSPARPRLRLIHWNAREARTRAASLRDAGYQVSWGAPADIAGLRVLRTRVPAAVVVDLTRLPAQGRDVGILLRTWKSTRQVPLLFVGGTPEKVKRTRQQLPDAIYTPWSRIRGALGRALATPVIDPVVPASVMAGYSGTPLPKKLGIKPDSIVVLVGAPDGFERTLGALPSNATVRRRDAGARELTLWFVRRRRDLERRIASVARRLGAGGLWILWPKQASPLAPDFTEKDVRRVGLAHGLVDFKVCAVDADWSGLKFVWRKGARSPVT